MATIGRPVVARESRARRKNIDIVPGCSGSRRRENKAMSSSNQYSANFICHREQLPQKVHRQKMGRSFLLLRCSQGLTPHKQIARKVGGGAQVPGDDDDGETSFQIGNSV